MDIPKPVARPKTLIKPKNPPRETKTAPAKREPLWDLHGDDGRGEVTIAIRAESEADAVSEFHDRFGTHPFSVKKRVFEHPEHLMDRPFKNLNTLLKGAKS